MDDREHISWVQSRLLLGALPSDSRTSAQQQLGATEVLIELLLAGLEPEEATVARFVALAATHKDWYEGADASVVIDLVEQGMMGQGVPAESHWVYQTSGPFTPPEPTFRDSLRSDDIGPDRAEAYASQAFEWLVSLVRSTAPSGSWSRVGSGLTKASETNSAALDLPSDGGLRTVVERQLPIAKITNMYNQVSQRLF